MFPVRPLTGTERSPAMRIKTLAFVAIGFLMPFSAAIAEDKVEPAEPIPSFVQGPVPTEPPAVCLSGRPPSSGDCEEDKILKLTQPIEHPEVLKADLLRLLDVVTDRLAKNDVPSTALLNRMLQVTSMVHKNLQVINEELRQRRLLIAKIKEAVMNARQAAVPPVPHFTLDVVPANTTPAKNLERAFKNLEQTDDERRKDLDRGTKEW